MDIVLKLLLNYRLKSLYLIFISCLILTSLLSYNSSDSSFNLAGINNTENIAGAFGAYSADLLYQLFGLIAYIFPICLLSFAYEIWVSRDIKFLWAKAIFVLLSVICFAYPVHNIEVPNLPSKAGGAIGFVVDKVLEIYVKDYILIAKFLSFSLGLVLLIFILNLKSTFYLQMTKKIFSFILLCFKKLYQLLILIGTYFKKRADAQAEKPRQKIIPSANKEDLADTSLTSPARTNFISENHPAPISENKSYKSPTHRSDAVSKQNNTIPSLDLLDASSNNKIRFQTKSELEENSIELLTVLNDFGIKGQIIDVREGPVVTSYEFEPAAGTKSSRVIGLADDIARSLCALSTRISVIPGRNVLGIELPNKERIFFRLKELIETPEFNNHDILLPLILGKDLGGKPLIADLAKMPHVLVAGTTGSGKSVAINAMIMSLIYRYGPDECRMIMIDPKMLELSAYDDIPHLLTPVVTEPGKAVIALKWAVKEMENRYRLMSNLGVRNIANYNSKILESIKSGEKLARKIQTGFDPETGKPIYNSINVELKKMPFIVVVVDEMADLMLVAGKDIESSVQRLAQMARAAGIHIIMATQRPSVDVITGVIKANFPSRISFRVTSKIDSRTILGEQGAEQLLGMGDMLYMGNSSRIIRVHGPFVDDKEVERVTNFLRSTGLPEYISSVTESDDDDSLDLLDDSVEDQGDATLYKKALAIIKNEKKTSISYIQRSLRIGYNRAANLVEEMEKNGILSAPNHSGKREILLDD